MTQEVSNISAWRLNKAEQKELAERVAKGECEKTAKKDIQRRKAIANENRKKAAQAVASKVAVPKASAKKRSPAMIAAEAAEQQQTATQKDPTNAAYYAEVEADIQAILKEFSGLENELPLHPCRLPTGLAQNLEFRSLISWRIARLPWRSTASTVAAFRCFGSIWFPQPLLAYLCPDDVCWICAPTTIPKIRRHS